MKSSTGAAARRATIVGLAVMLSVVVLPGSGSAGTTERVSVSSAGEQGNAMSLAAGMSADGRFVAFSSYANNLVPGDTNGGELFHYMGSDIFVHDRLTGTTERVSVSSTGEQGDSESEGPAAISADGRFVAFWSIATNLVPGDTNTAADVFVHDRATETTERVSVSSVGQQGDQASAWPSISADGRFVAFSSFATNLVAGDTNSISDIFVRDRVAGTTERVSLTSSGTQGNGASDSPAISQDGRFVVFASVAGNLVPGDTDEEPDIYLRDRLSGTTEQVNLTPTGGDSAGSFGTPAITPDGRYVCFEGISWDLIPNPPSGVQAYLRDRTTGTVEVVSLSNAGQAMQWTGYSMSGTVLPDISADGRFVAFVVPPNVTNIVPQDVNDGGDICIRDRANGTTELVSVGNTGQQGDGYSQEPAINADGRFVAFSSFSTNLVQGDTNRTYDIFVRDLGTPDPPQLGIVINDGAVWTNSLSVTLRIVLPQGSAEIRLRNAPDDWGPWEPVAAQKSWTLSSGDGLKTVCMQCRERWWSLSQEVCDEILLDTTPPSNCSVVINGGAACTDRLQASLTLSATDASQMRFSNDGQTWSAWQTYAATKSWTLSQGRGTKTVWFQCRDSRGNESPAISDSIWLIVFDDVLCAYSARECIEALAQRGIVSACAVSPTWYCPFYAATRAFMAEALCRAAGKTWLDSATPTFADVPRDHPAYGWIERLADAASWGGVPLTDGCGWQGAQKLFCPDASVTREQAAKFVCRAAGRPPMPTCTGIFRDVPSVRRSCGFVERLADAASWPGGVAVTNGCGKSGTTWWYCPDRPLTRGEMAVHCPCLRHSAVGRPCLGPPRRARARPPYRFAPAEFRSRGGVPCPYRCSYLARVDAAVLC